jgi:integrating conjugative element protein (TIGR03761 family)
VSSESTARAATAPIETPSAGALRAAVTLTLQTRHAQRLVQGRSRANGKPDIIGLLGFAHLLRPIWHAARADDPYADAWLLTVHGALESAWFEIEAAEQGLTAALQQLPALDVCAPVSQSPVRVVLQFGNPYAFRGARLLSRYDGLVRTALGAQHLGMLAAAECARLLHAGGRAVRRAFQSPVGFRTTGVDRRAIAQGTARAQQARDLLGALPDDVLEGTRRAPYAPVIVEQGPRAEVEPQ